MNGEKDGHEEEGEQDVGSIEAEGTIESSRSTSATREETETEIEIARVGDRRRAGGGSGTSIIKVSGTRATDLLI